MFTRTVSFYCTSLCSVIARGLLECYNPRFDFLLFHQSYRNCSDSGMQNQGRTDSHYESG